MKSKNNFYTNHSDITTVKIVMILASFFLAFQISIFSLFHTTYIQNIIPWFSLSIIL